MCFISRLILNQAFAAGGGERTTMKFREVADDAAFFSLVSEGIECLRKAADPGKIIPDITIQELDRKVKNLSDELCAETLDRISSLGKAERE